MQGRQSAFRFRIMGLEQLAGLRIRFGIRVYSSLSSEGWDS